MFSNLHIFFLFFQCDPNDVLSQVLNDSDMLVFQTVSDDEEDDIYIQKHKKKNNSKTSKAKQNKQNSPTPPKVKSNSSRDRSQTHSEMRPPTDII